MIFKSTTIAPKGRNKYGNYISAGNVTNKVVSYTNNNTILKPISNTDTSTTNNSAYGLALSKTQGLFDWKYVDDNGTVTDTIQVFGFKDMDRVPVYIGNLGSDTVSDSCDIDGMPSGMTVIVIDNGTTATTINVNVDATISVRNGKITIPANIYVGNVSSPDDDDKTNWIEEKDKTKSVLLEYNFDVLYNLNEKGEKGNRGASIRGAVDYTTITKTRRFCNGKFTNALYPEDEYYIDIMMYDGHYYQCKQSYNWTVNDIANMTTVINRYWTLADQEYKFVATDLLLANNAKIKFASTNDIYLLDDNDVVTAGAAGGSGVNFWAGSVTPSDGVFKVKNDGTLIAQKGTFGNLTIGVDEFNESKLYGTHKQVDNETINTISIQPHILQLGAKSENTGEQHCTVTIAPYHDRDIYDFNATLEINQNGNKGYNAIWTDGDIVAADVFSDGGSFTRLYKNPEDDAVYYIDEWATMSPIGNLRIVPLCSTSALFTKNNNMWHFNGISLGISSLLYPNIVQHPSDYTWGFNSKNTNSWTGIASDKTPKQNNVLYIKLN